MNNTKTYEIDSKFNDVNDLVLILRDLEKLHLKEKRDIKYQNKKKDKIPIKNFSIEYNHYMHLHINLHIFYFLLLAF